MYLYNDRWIHSTYTGLYKNTITHTHNMHTHMRIHTHTGTHTHHISYDSLIVIISQLEWHKGHSVHMKWVLLSLLYLPLPSLIERRVLLLLSSTFHPLFLVPMMPQHLIWYFWFVVLFVEHLVWSRRIQMVESCSQRGKHNIIW